MNSLKQKMRQETRGYLALGFVMCVIAALAGAMLSVALHRIKDMRGDMRTVPVDRADLARLTKPPK